MHSFVELFGDFLDKDIKKLFESVNIEKCNLDTANRNLKVVCKSASYIDSESISKVKNLVKSALGLTDCSIECCFSSDAFCEKACEDIVGEIRVKYAVLNGYFNSATYKIVEDQVCIELKYGGKKQIDESGFEKLFCGIVKRRFDKDITLNFSGELETVEMEKVTPAPVQSEAPKRASAPKPKEKITFEKSDT